MLYTIIVILLALWLLGFIFEIAGGFIHAILLIAAAIFIYNLVTKNKATV